MKNLFLSQIAVTCIFLTSINSGKLGMKFWNENELKGIFATKIFARGNCTLVSKFNAGILSDIQLW